MNCPHCTSRETKERTKTTSLGYRTFCCSTCKRTFNERTGTAFNFLEYPTDLVLLVVLWRLRYKLSLRDLAEMFLERGFVFTHEAVHDWEARFAPLLADQLRIKRRGRAGTSWHVDETYVKVHGNWCYLYRAIDRDGHLVDSMLSEKRDMEAAKRFFQQAADVVGPPPERVRTDGHDSYPRAIRETLGSEVIHRCNRYLNNRLEQDHRGIKQRYNPMRGFGSVVSASRFCRAFEEVRQFFRVRTTMKPKVSLVQQREAFSHRLNALKAMVLVASYRRMSARSAHIRCLDSCDLSSDISHF
jgi:putative transposase